MKSNFFLVIKKSLFVKIKSEINISYAFGLIFLDSITTSRGSTTNLTMETSPNQMGLGLVEGISLLQSKELEFKFQMETFNARSCFK